MDKGMRVENKLNLIVYRTGRKTNLQSVPVN